MHLLNRERGHERLSPRVIDYTYKQHLFLLECDIYLSAELDRLTDNKTYSSQTNSNTSYNSIPNKPSMTGKDTWNTGGRIVDDPEKGVDIEQQKAMAMTLGLPLKMVPIREPENPVEYVKVSKDVIGTLVNKLNSQGSKK